MTENKGIAHGTVDVADLIAGSLGVSRGFAYELMRRAVTGLDEEHCEVLVPRALPPEILAEAAFAMDTGNPKHLWDFVLARLEARNA